MTLIVTSEGHKQQVSVAEARESDFLGVLLDNGSLSQPIFLKCMNSESIKLQIFLFAQTQKNRLNWCGCRKSS